MSNRKFLPWYLLGGASVVVLAVQLTTSHPVESSTSSGRRAEAKPQRLRESVHRATHEYTASTATDDRHAVRPAVLAASLDAKPIRDSHESAARFGSPLRRDRQPPVSHFSQVKAQLRANGRTPEQIGDSASESETENVAIPRDAWAAEFGIRPSDAAQPASGPAPLAETGAGRSTYEAISTASAESSTESLTDPTTDSEIELVGGQSPPERSEVGDRDGVDLSPQVPDESPWHLPPDVEIQVAHHLEYGKSLARRGALYSAELEFLRGMRLIAQTIDRLAGNTEHTRRLDIALQAIREADELSRITNDATSISDLRELTSGHATRIDTPQRLAGMTPVEVIEGYRKYAAQNLVYSGGRTIVAAEAAFCLGRLNSLRIQTQAREDGADQAHALLFHQVALASNPQHDRAANELGVLYAKMGRLQGAKRVFIQCLRIRQRPETWANLTVVHERLGERRLAELAAVELRKSLNADGPQNNIDRVIKWIPPEQFARQSARPIVEMPAHTESIDTVDPASGAPGDVQSVMERTSFETGTLRR